MNKIKIFFSLFLFVFSTAHTFGLTKAQEKKFRQEFSKRGSKLCSGITAKELGALTWKNMSDKSGGISGEISIAEDANKRTWVRKINTRKDRLWQDKNALLDPVKKSGSWLEKTFGISYLSYMENNPSSLIIPICAVRTDKTKKDWPIYMPRVVQGFQHTFDIKAGFPGMGDDQAREKSFKKLVGNQKFITKQDWAQLKKDFKFLKDNERWDYSLLVGLKLDASNKVAEYQLKIIDILMKKKSIHRKSSYTKLENFWKKYIGATESTTAVRTNNKPATKAPKSSKWGKAKTKLSAVSKITKAQKKAQAKKLAKAKAAEKAEAKKLAKAKAAEKEEAKKLAQAQAVEKEAAQVTVTQPSLRRARTANLQIQTQNPKKCSEISCGSSTDCSMKFFCQGTKDWVSSVKSFLGKKKSPINRPKKWENSFNQLVQKVVNPPFSYPIDQKKKNNLLACYKENNKKTELKRYLDRVRHVSFTEWHGALCSSLQKSLQPKAILSKRKIDEIYLWTEENAQKSQLWSAALAFQCKNKCGDRNCGDLLREKIKGVFTNAQTSEIIPKVSKDSAANKIRKHRAILFFDDMAYSGTQLSKDIKGVSTALNKYKGWQGTYTHLIAIIPYVGVTALTPDKLGKISGLKIYRKEKIKIYDHNNELNKAGFAGGDYAIYFDHKIADRKSIQTDILLGKLPASRTSSCKANERQLYYRIFKNCQYYPNSPFVCPTPPYKDRLSLE